MDHYLARLQNATKKFWDKPALNTIGGESYTYGDMAVQIEKFHCFFEAIGIKKGDKIALCANNGARWGMTYMSVVTYETVIVPILADFTSEAVLTLVNHSDSIGFFTTADRWKKQDPANFPALRFVVDVDSWGLLYSKDESVTAAFDGMEAAFKAKHPAGYGLDDVVFPTDNMEDLAA
ncbi:MAG: AMP-binding protein, partial [Bacteroidales bacterium]|nr:AMP-binding protein [Bacteroidales bacterium]